MGQCAFSSLHLCMLQLSSTHLCHTHSFSVLLFSLVGGPHLADDLSGEYKLHFSPVYVTLGMFISSPVISEILWKGSMRWKTPSMQMKRAMYCLIIITINIYFWVVN